MAPTQSECPKTDRHATGFCVGQFQDRKLPLKTASGMTASEQALSTSGNEVSFIRSGKLPSSAVKIRPHIFHSIAFSHAFGFAQLCQCVLANDEPIPSGVRHLIGLVWLEEMYYGLFRSDPTTTRPQASERAAPACTT